jgi:hypothetical protein
LKWQGRVFGRIVRTVSLRALYTLCFETRQDEGMKIPSVFALWFFPAILTLKAEPVVRPEPGPEENGLCMRLMVQPMPEPDREGFELQLDLLNKSQKDITLRADWRDDGDEGDLKDYIEAATSIECVPAVAPWIGGVRQGQRKAPQPEYVLKRGEVLSLSWKTDRRRLKNRVTDPNKVQNPEFSFPGLYSVHATLNVSTSDGALHLRSNEQMVSVGGSRAMPKHTYGRLISAMLGLGSLHKIEPGDQFEIGNFKAGHWRLTISRVEPESSTGELEVLTRKNYPNSSDPPRQLMEATLVVPKRN